MANVTGMETLPTMRMDPRETDFLSSHTVAWMSVVPLVLSAIIAITVIGNLLVVIAFVRDMRIRADMGNYFILNLAVTDFLVGAVSMTFNLAWLIHDHWPLGELACKLYTIVDYVLGMMSTTTVVLISWDRLRLLKMGMAYKAFQTRRRIGVILLVCWSTYLVFYTAIAFSWDEPSQELDQPETCEMAFLNSLPGTIVINIVEFVIPFSLLLVFNASVYINIKKRSKGIVVKSLRRRTNKISAFEVSERCSNPSRSADDSSDALEEEGRKNCPQSAPRKCRVDVEVQPSNHHATESRCPVAKAAEQDAPFDPDQRKTEMKSTREKQLMFARHRKSALVLSVLVGCFVTCYLPYNITSIVYAVCQDTCFRSDVWETISYLLWCNSTINPIVYAATNVHFRRNFRQLLCFDKWKCIK